MIYEIPFAPIPLARARSGKRGFYDPQLKAKQNLQWYIKATYPDYSTFIEPITVNFTFLMPIPKSWSKKKTFRYTNAPHDKRPDLDNLVKFQMDALNGILWEDDCIIYAINAKKIYAKEPKTILEITE